MLEETSRAIFRFVGCQGIDSPSGTVSLEFSVPVHILRVPITRSLLVKLTALLLLLFLGASFLLTGCSILRDPPGPMSSEQRIAVFEQTFLASGHNPPTHTITVRWNSYQVPYILADSDEDAAFALGYTHAHLRLGQMEVLKRISMGRLSEMLGPYKVPGIDEALRILDFGRAAPEILETMPPETRTWLECYVVGVNHYKDSLAKGSLPHEYTIFDLDPEEPWTAIDSLRLGRLFGTDVNWLTWLGMLSASGEPNFEDAYRRARQAGQESTVSFEKATVQLEALTTLLRGYSRSGSNSVVVSSAMSDTGKGLIANDPHLGFQLPNAWLMAGLKSPSYHVVGMMPVGVPVFGFGRTPHLAWGGTNLRSLSSDLVDLTDVEDLTITETPIEIGVRWWFDRTATRRVSPYGPIITDATVFPNPLDKQLAVRWVGHEPSDDITALLGVLKAKNGEEMRAALEPFSLPPQNFLYVDRDGNIGHIVSTHLPKRPEGHGDSIFVSPEVSDAAWNDILTTSRLPAVLDQKVGYIASANNRPTHTEYPIGYFFPSDERIRRLQQMMNAHQKVSLEDLRRIQLDVVSLNALELTQTLSRLDRSGFSENAAKALALLEDWDGAYEADSRQPVLMTAFLEHVSPRLFQAGRRNGEFERIKDRAFLIPAVVQLLETLPEDSVNEAAAQSLEWAYEKSATKVWGDIHRLRPKMFLGNVPLIGKKYVMGSYPVSGTQETVMKTAGNLTHQEHETFYGAQSRHLSDMSDPDANYFVLVGGNDGWINSANANDQTPLWAKGQTIQMPLTDEAIEEQFKAVTRIEPDGP